MTSLLSFGRVGRSFRRWRQVFEFGILDVAAREVIRTVTLRRISFGPAVGLLFSRSALEPHEGTDHPHYEPANNEDEE